MLTALKTTLTSFLGSQARPARAAHLRLEALDRRDLMAAIAPPTFANGILTIKGTASADVVYVHQSDATDRIYVGTTLGGQELGSFSGARVDLIKVLTYGGDDRVYLDGVAGRDRVRESVTAELGDGDDRYYGGAGNDNVNGGNGVDRVWGYGGADTLLGTSGSDHLFGGDGEDLIDGGNQHDEIEGGEGNDWLLGGAGDDTLRGGQGDDYLNAGAGANVVVGGAGVDSFRRTMTVGDVGFSLSTPGDAEEPLDDENAPADEPTQISGAFLAGTVAGDSPWDVAQRQTPTCAFLASLAAVAGRTGQADDLVRAIRYNATADTYTVPIFVGGRWTQQSVNGDWTEGRDPVGKLWVTLYQKAYLQAHGVTSRAADGWCLPAARWTSPMDDWQKAGVALQSLTGYAARWTAAGDAAPGTLRAQLRDSYWDGFVANSKVSGTGSGVIGNHSYMVTDCYQSNGTWLVTLYNPWGHDNQDASGNFMTADGRDDGLITLTWDQFKANFEGYNRV